MKLYILATPQVRQIACQAIMQAPEGYAVRIGPAGRTLGQNARFHAICGDIARSKYPFQGKPRSSKTWKVIMVSAHATATKEGAEFTVGLEGEVINLRESTADMSKKRSSSLIEYVTAFCVKEGIPLRDQSLGIEK